MDRKMVPINASTDDTEASNSNSGSGTQTRTGMGAGTGGESEMGTGAGNMAGSETAARSPPDVHIVDIGDQPNIPGGEVPEDELTMFVRINPMAMLETTASGLGKLEMLWVAALLQGGLAFTLQTKDFVFITVIWLFGGFRIFCGSPKHNMRRLALFYWFQLISALMTSVLSGMRLYSQDFGQIEKINKANSDFALNLFYIVALAEALMLLAWCYLLRRPFGN